MQGDKWSRVIRADDIPLSGATFTLMADATMRAFIAQEAELLELPRLEAKFEVDRQGKGGLRVKGRVTATIVQACVVTLEPLQSELDEAIDVVFIPESEGDQQKVVDIDLSAESPDSETETLVGGALDLGALATEFMLLGIKPYPRKADAAFEPPASQAETSPFAALAALKSKLSGTS